MIDHWPISCTFPLSVNDNTIVSNKSLDAAHKSYIYHVSLSQCHVYLKQRLPSAHLAYQPYITYMYEKNAQCTSVNTDWVPFTQRVSDACQPPVKVGHVFSRKKSVFNNGTIHHSAAAVHNASLSSSSVYQVVENRHFLTFSKIGERRRVWYGTLPISTLPSTLTT